MSPEQITFLLNILSQITVNAADPKAVETATMVQSIITSLSEPRV